MKTTSLDRIKPVSARLRTRFIPLVTLVAVIIAAGFSATAETFLKSQIVGFPTGNLGSAGLEGWQGSDSQVTVTNGAGSLDGSPLGLVVSKGDRAFLSVTNGSPVTRNVFVAGGAFRPDIETNLFYSFLLKFDDAADVSTDAGGELVTQVNRQNSGSQDHWQTWARNSGGQIQLGIRKRGAASALFATTNISAGQTVLVVVRQHIIPPAGTNDVIYMWINPTPTTLGGDFTNAPAPSLAVTGGLEDTSNTGPGRFYVVPGAHCEFDELRIANSWAEATPSPLNCNSAVVTSDPADATVTEGINVTLSVTAGGTGPNYLWQLSTDSGANWSAVTDGFGLTTPDYTTPNLTLADNGNQYRCVVSVDCDSSSVTSAVATVTVNSAVVTPAGLVVEDAWTDLDRTNAPISTNNSIWYASTASSLVFQGSDLFGVPASGSSRLWIGYFTDDTITNLPVSLAVGGTIKATWVFNCDGIVETNGGLRVGLFDYADGGTRVTGDDFGSGSSGNGEQVRGYMLDLDFAQTFTDDNPLDIRARTVLTSGNLLGSTSAYIGLGSGPGGLNGAPAFQSLTDYTLELSVTRQAQNSVDVTAVISGGGTNWTWSVTDSTYAYHRFDAFAIRPNSLETTANDFLFSLFKVEVSQAVQPFEITSIKRLSADAVKLTWEALPGTSYQVQSRDLLGSGGWVTNATVVATSASQSYTNSGVTAINARYYRVVAP